MEQHGARFEQVVVLGAGIDAKPIQQARPHQTWYLCDLREMLRERSRRLNDIGKQDVNGISVALDFRMQGWHGKILAAGFDPNKRTLVFFEGVSMYLSRGELTQTAAEIAHLVSDPESVLWMDHVSEALFGMQRVEVTSFLGAMSRLGEPFVTGFLDPSDFFGTRQWSTLESASASEVLGTQGDPVYEQYRFSLMTRRPDSADHLLPPECVPVTPGVSLPGNAPLQERQSVP